MCERCDCNMLHRPQGDRGDGVHKTEPALIPVAVVRQAPIRRRVNEARDSVNAPAAYVTFLDQVEARE